MTTSSLVAAKQLLMSKLQTALGTPSADVEAVKYSHPGSELGIDAIYLGDAREGEHNIPTMKAGHKRREESYVIPVVFEYVRPGQSAAEAEARAFERFALLETVLADDPNLGRSSDPTFRARVRSWESTCSFTEASRGWRCRLTVDVLVQNRLT